MTDDTTRKDLATLGNALEDDGELWKTALRALASPSGLEPLSAEHREMVAAQVYDKTEREDSLALQLSAEFVNRFVEVHDLKGLDDVGRLLGRERHERQNYEGQIGMLRGRSDSDVLSSIMENARGEDDDE